MKVVVCLPAYNESSVIVDYIREITGALSRWDTYVVVVDDCSTDHTAALLKSSVFETHVEIHSNDSNRGHGPTVIRALSRALELQPDLVVSADGDGHVPGHEIRNLVLEIESTDVDVVEARRCRRSDPAFRRVSTYAAKLLVKLLGAQNVTDANTPLRAYKSGALSKLIKEIPH